MSNRYDFRWIDENTIKNNPDDIITQIYEKTTYIYFDPDRILLAKQNEYTDIIKAKINADKNLSSLKFNILNNLVELFTTITIENTVNVYLFNPYVDNTTTERIAFTIEINAYIYYYTHQYVAQNVYRDIPQYQADNTINGSFRICNVLNDTTNIDFYAIVVRISTVDEHEILIREPKNYRNKWNFIAGKREPNETIFQTFKREGEEETFIDDFKEMANFILKNSEVLIFQCYEKDKKSESIIIMHFKMKCNVHEALDKYKVPLVLLQTSNPFYYPHVDDKFRLFRFWPTVESNVPNRPSNQVQLTQFANVLLINGLFTFYNNIQTMTCSLPALVSRSREYLNLQNSFNDEYAMYIYNFINLLQKYLLRTNLDKELKQLAKNEITVDVYNQSFYKIHPQLKSFAQDAINPNTYPNIFQSSTFDDYTLPYILSHPFCSANYLSFRSCTSYAGKFFTSPEQCIDFFKSNETNQITQYILETMFNYEKKLFEGGNINTCANRLRTFWKLSETAGLNEIVFLLKTEINNKK